MPLFLRKSVAFSPKQGYNFSSEKSEQSNKTSGVVVDKIVDTNTGSVTTPDPVRVRQVVSKKTANEVMDMLDYAVSSGTGKYADVKGYSIGGKSGTSENLGQGDGTYVASFLGLSPTVNTQVVVLVALYNPQGKSFQGGEIAGPVVGQILSEVFSSEAIFSILLAVSKVPLVVNDR